MSAVDTAPDVTALGSPYVGLKPYTQENAAMFFGRDREQTVLISNLRASRLTLLYAQSGAGKSSLLRAGVAVRLAELAQRDFNQRGTARNIPVVFSSWRDDPTVELIGGIQKAIIPFLRRASPPTPAPDRLDQAIQAASRATDAALLVILDQFEAYFPYQSGEMPNRPFADELASCINRADLRAKFLISIREDAYSSLGDLFKGRISNVYGNYFHLEHLTRQAAREAIEKPIASFNKLHMDQVPVQIEPDLVDVVLDQLSQFAPDQGGIGRDTEGNGAEPHRDEVAAPYLQLVMKRLWDTELGKPSRKLRRETLEELGEAKEIVRTHIDRALGNLPDEQREAAVDALQRLVTPSGTRIALAASDLADPDYTGRPVNEVNAALQRLAGSDDRILGTVLPPPGRPGGPRYEIAHDLLVPAILDWGRRRKAARLECEKEAAERQAQIQKRRARMFGALAIGSAVLLVVVIVLAIVAWKADQDAVSQSRVAQSEELINESELLGYLDPTISKLLSVAAWRLYPSSQDRHAMLDAAARPGIATLTGHTDRVHALAFSPDGNTLVTGSYDGTVRLWNVAAGRQVGAPLTGHDDRVYSVAFSPDGKVVASGADDGMVRLWDVATHRQVGAPLTGHDGEIYSVAFSPDGKTLATGADDGMVRLWDVATHRQVGAPLTGHDGEIRSVAFSPDGKTLATGADDGTVRLWDVATQRQAGAPMTGSTEAVSSVAFSPDGKTLASGGDDGTVRLWDVATQQPTGSWPTFSPVFDVAFSPDGKLLATGDANDMAQLWDVATHQPIGNPLIGYSLAFSPDGKTLATGGYDHFVRLWNVISRTGIAALTGHIKQVNSVVFSPDGKTLASGGADGTVRLWDAATRQPIGAPLSGRAAVASVAFSPDGKTLASGGADGTVRLWDVTTRQPIGAPLSGRAAVASVAFSPDGKTLASGGADGTVRLWDVTTRQPIGAPMTGSTGAVYSVAFSPDGKTLASGGADGTVRLWDATTRRQAGAPMTGSTEAVYSVAFSPDGKTLASGGADDTVRLWDAATRREKGNGLTGHADWVSSVVFSPDGKTLASGSYDGTVRLWDMTIRQQIGEALSASASASRVYSVAFSPDGKTLATGSYDGAVRLWDVTYLVGTAAGLCNSVQGSLTPVEWTQYLPSGPAYRSVCP